MNGFAAVERKIMRMRKWAWCELINPLSYEVLTWCLAQLRPSYGCPSTREELTVCVLSTESKVKVTRKWYSYPLKETVRFDSLREPLFI